VRLIGDGAMGGPVLHHDPDKLDRQSFGP